MSGQRPDRPMSRRNALGLGAGAAAAMALGRTGAAGASAPSNGPLSARAVPADHLDVVEFLRPEIRPRSDWGADRPVTGQIVPEDDVRFLLVHHTASTNDYRPEDVADRIRGFHSFHTGPEKGWPDVAYNFLIDRFGGIWEARAGSVAGPVRGDATGGSQGFALLCSLIGDHREVPVSPEARASLVDLLAWLAERHAITTDPGSTVDFVSRGSSRWPPGAAVSAATIAGHRDMSETTCPGDQAYRLITDDLPNAVTERRRQAMATVGPVTGSTPSSSSSPSNSSPSNSSSSSSTPDPGPAPNPTSGSADEPSASTTPGSASSGGPVVANEQAVPETVDDAGGGGAGAAAATVAATAAAAGAVAAIVSRRGRQRDAQDVDSETQAR